eukprot:COSAG02_NODE_46_length_45443_cov_36.731497_38_plen_179_part_00
MMTIVVIALTTQIIIIAHIHTISCRPPPTGLWPSSRNLAKVRWAAALCLEVLQYAHANGCPWDSDTCSNAAENGHLEVVQYAHANGCPWDSSTCSVAAENGHLEVLQYAHANGCPWDWGTCMNAAAAGHLEVLQYARTNGCPWNKWTCATRPRFRWPFCVRRRRIWRRKSCEAGLRSP